jgi:hypothetical protein
VPLFTADQLDRVRAIIRQHTRMLGISYLSASEDPDFTAQLREHGLLEADAPPPDLISDSFAYGQLLARAENLNLREAGPEEILNRLAADPAPPLSESEQAIVEMAHRHAGQYVQGLGDRITSDVLTEITALEGGLTHDQIKAVVADETARNRQRRATAGNLKKNLTDRVGTWERDWQRLGTSEVNDAIQDGTAVTFERDHDDPFVSKLPRPDACPDCVRLYLTAGQGSAPIVFSLEELRANGTNVGRKRANWLATVGNIHPWCGCSLVRIPPGMTWSVEDGSPELVPESMKKSDDSDEKHLTGSPFKLHYRTERHGLPISIENRKGSNRKWKDRDGNEGSTKMRHAYGYIRGTHGADDDEIDCFLGPDDNASRVFVVHQRIRKDDGTFYGHDEDKVMLGFSSAREAKRAYLVHYNDPGFFGSMTELSTAKFKKVIDRNKGKQLKLVKSFDAGEIQVLEKAQAAKARRTPGRKPWLHKGGHYGIRDQLDIALLPIHRAPKPPNIIQGADDVPVKSRPSHMVGVADAAGYSAEGRRKAKAKAGPESREDARRRNYAPDGRHWAIQGIAPHMTASSHESAFDFWPKIIAEFRKQARENALEVGAWKREFSERIAKRRNEDSRVSDLTRKQRVQQRSEAGAPQDRPLIKGLMLPARFLRKPKGAE